LGKRTRNTASIEIQENVMASMSDYLENKIIDWLFRGVAFTPPTGLYVALFTTNDNDANSSAVEVSGGSYARVNLAPSTTNWAATNGATTTTNPSSGTGGTTSNNAAITFPTPTGNWGTITGVGIFDASTSGNLLFYGALTASQVVNTGNPFSFPISALSNQIDN
jgi:hypothetical protein